MPQFIVTADDLVKRFGERAAVDGLTFGIRPAEIFSLLGPNGAGKTTTLAILACLLQPTAGDATVDGHSVRREPLAVKRAIGVVPQEIALYPTLSARENLAFWGRMYGMSGATLRKRVDEVLDLVGLRDRAKDRIETYSGGMQRRINLAAGLLHRPKVIFMDEPTVGIDPQSRRNLLDTVKSLNAEGMTVLYTTHYMEEAQELSSRIGIIDHGKLIALGTLAELTRLVGEEDVVELRVPAECSQSDLLQAFSTVSGVKQATTISGNGNGHQAEAAAQHSTIRLLARDGNAALPDLIGLANQRGVRVSNVAVQAPNLEAVFLHLTGRTLRD